MRLPHITAVCGNSGCRLKLLLDLMTQRGEVDYPRQIQIYPLRGTCAHEASFNSLRGGVPDPVEDAVRRVYDRVSDDQRLSPLDPEGNPGLRLRLSLREAASTGLEGFNRWFKWRYPDPKSILQFDIEPVLRVHFHVDGEIVEVCGHPDLIIHNSDISSLYDLKNTWRKPSAQQEHVVQLAVYRELILHLTRVQIDDVALIYLRTGDPERQQRVIPVDKLEEATEEFMDGLTTVLELHKVLDNPELIPHVVFQETDFMCAMCDARSICRGF